VRVPAERLVGGENRGWDCILAGLQADRITSAAGNVGAAQGCLDMQRHYRDARAATIAAGTSQMQRNIIAGLMGLKVG